MCFSTGPSQKVKSGPVSICHTHATKTNFNSLVNKEKQMKSTTKAFIPHQISNGKSDATSVRGVPQPPSVHTSPFSPPSHLFIPFFFCSWELETMYLFFFWLQKSLTWLPSQGEFFHVQGKASYTLGHCGGLGGQQLILLGLVQHHFSAETWSRKQVSWRQHILLA